MFFCFGQNLKTKYCVFPSFPLFPATCDWQKKNKILPEHDASYDNLRMKWSCKHLACWGIWLTCCLVISYPNMWWSWEVDSIAQLCYASGCNEIIGSWCWGIQIFAPSLIKTPTGDCMGSRRNGAIMITIRMKWNYRFLMLGYPRFHYDYPQHDHFRSLSCVIQHESCLPPLAIIGSSRFWQ